MNSTTIDTLIGYRSRTLDLYLKWLSFKMNQYLNRLKLT